MKYKSFLVHNNTLLFGDGFLKPHNKVARLCSFLLFILLEPKYKTFLVSDEYTCTRHHPDDRTLQFDLACIKLLVPLDLACS